ncbi:beta-galactosidase [Microbacterium oryzae]|uniref:Beta-galactosidase n=1 Tax=Microbacterium oryzae TaxID=743009 RepID=A0A6I6E4Z9_9MICO|nr:beta-galactosidase [Microbacterium oryzae]QGU26388.1 beta-galactosidase [Microbacterium oryzae]
MLYGADYNPDQWPEDVWDDDVARMQEAGVTTVSLGIFSWSRIQPEPDVWDFSWLDTIIGKLHAGGIGVNLATATASPPPWATVAHPDILAADENGAPYWHGSRQHHSPSSPTYRALAAELVRRLAERYAHHPAVVMWHVGNESGCHLPVEYSDAARDAFRRWLRNRYQTIPALNEAWGTAFWSQRYGSWEEVFPPRKAPYSRNPSQVLDYHRFMSDMWLECYIAERDIIRAAGGTQPISTNMMGPFKPADYTTWAPHIDVITDDCYPDPLDPQRVRNTAFQRDLVRSLKRGHPWLLMEQATDAVNWRPANPSKRDGQLSAETAQSIGRGADGILFFQWRQSRAGSEKFHSAMLPHAGTRTRTWREVTALGASLAELPELPTPGDDAQVALVFDWENWWALEAADHPNRVDYLALMREWYGALHRRGIMVDIVKPEHVDGRYRLAVAPFLYLLRDEGAAALERFAAQGGTLLAGPFSDIVDGNDRFRADGFLTQLGRVLGVALEDFRALVPPALDQVAERAGEEGATGGGADTRIEADLREARFALDGADAVGTYFAEALFADDAEIVAAFTTGPSRGRPALTRRAHGAGSAWYLATMPDAPALDRVVARLVEDARVSPVIPSPLPENVEVARRGDLVTLINHGTTPVTVEVDGRRLEDDEAVGSVALEPQESAFLIVPARVPVPA